MGPERVLSEDNCLIGNSFVAEKPGPLEPLFGLLNQDALCYGVLKHCVMCNEHMTPHSFGTMRLM